MLRKGSDGVQNSLAVVSPVLADKTPLWRGFDLCTESDSHYLGPLGQPHQCYSAVYPIWVKESSVTSLQNSTFNTHLYGWEKQFWTWVSVCPGKNFPCDNFWGRAETDVLGIQLSFQLIPTYGVPQSGRTMLMLQIYRLQCVDPDKWLHLSGSHFFPHVKFREIAVWHHRED